MQRLKYLRGDLRDVILLAVAWAALLSLLLHGFVASYFPLSDEWALLAHSDPRFADPVSWFRSGFAGYFTEPPGLAGPYSNFLRPVFNLCYWLQGIWLEPESGARLYFNYVVIGACSGACLLTMRGTNLPRWSKLLLAAVVPLMPGFLPSSSLLFFPMMAFDPLVACLCVLAVSLYQRERFFASALVLLIAVLTKEASVPITAALSLLYLIEHRQRLIAKDRQAWRHFIALCAPMVLWLACRYAVFGSLSQGTYTHIDGAGDALRFLPQTIVRVPFWFDRLPGLTSGFRPLLVLANAAMVIAGLTIIAKRIVQQGHPHVLEFALVVSYIFMLRYGLSERFGATLDLLVVACTALWLNEPESRRLGIVVATGLVIGLAATLNHGIKNFEARRDALMYYHDIGRGYVKALRAMPTGARVVVLNDPTSWFSRLDSLLRVERISASVIKVADDTCYMPLSSWLRQCSASLRVEASDGHYLLDQSCGIDLCGAAPGRGQQISYSPTPGLQVDLNPGSVHRTDELDGGRWRSIGLVVNDQETRILYFDPASGNFIVRVAEKTREGP